MDSSSLYEEIQRKVNMANNGATYNWKIPAPKPHDQKAYDEYQKLVNDHAYSSWGVGPRCREHIGDSEMTEFVDGVFVSYCKTCNNKIVFEMSPGSLPKIKIRAMLTDAMLGEIDLAEISILKENLERERARLEEAESQLRLILQMIRNKYVVGISSTKQSAEHQRSERDALGEEKTALGSLAGSLNHRPGQTLPF